MEPEALDAFATQSTRPGALEAASTDDGATQTPTIENNDSLPPSAKPVRPALNRLSTPLGQRTDGTETAAKVVEEVVQAAEGVVEGVKAAVHEAVAWAEKKADELARSEDYTGPYDSPAMAAGGLSELDVIAAGVLPATIPAQEDKREDREDSARGSGSESGE